MITHKHIKENFPYDGSQINPSWSFKKFGIKGSSIITWVGPVNIQIENLKDFADVDLEIKSANMINFIVEFFDCQPANMRIAYLRQRLLVMIFQEELFNRNVILKREGDDLFFNNKKLSISIATASISSMKIHFALNLEDIGTPSNVETIGLYEIKDINGKLVFNENNLEELVKSVVNKYILEIETIDNDISKTKVI